MTKINHNLRIVGKFHPLIVHLPIGILLLNAFFVFLSKTKRYNYLSAAIPITLLLGALSAVAACFTGWLLSENGDYTEGVLTYHKWLGIAVATASLLLYFSKKHDNILLWLVLITGLSVTGHLGGTLTHGENYLFADEKGQNTEGGVVTKKLPENIQEAVVYSDIIEPILKEKCMSCHNSTKQKGKLRMDDKDAFLKGGENGVIAIAGQADNSEMVKRLVLDLDAKHHMPPKGKMQPTEQDILLLRWWIDKGLTFDKKVKDIEQPDAVKAIFANFTTTVAKKENPYIPTETVEAADEKLMDSVRKQGILLMRVAPQSPYLQANFVSVPKAGDREVAMLLPFAKQLVWLKLGNTKITDSAMETVAKMTHLTRLSLENTAITHKGLATLTTLSHLQYLNLVGTKVTSDGLPPLSNLSGLKQVFLYKTTIAPNDLKDFQQKMPQTVFDTGGYIVPSWESDTAVLKKSK
jgi:uncharacterized membrane protein